MSDLDKLEKKYEKGSKTKDIKESISKLKETPSNPDTKRAFESRKETLESIIQAAKQATAGFKSQWSGLDDEGKVGIGKGTPGIYYNTVAIPAIAGVVDEKYAPDFAVEADKKAGKIKEAVRKDLGIEEPKGTLQHLAYAGGEMLGQVPVPASWLGKVRNLGMAGKIAAAPIEYLSPSIDPKAINYAIGTGFGGGLGIMGEALGEPDKKALGGLIQKYENGGKVGRFFSAVDKAIETLKQKKGTGEQVLRQLETTPGVKPEELESRAIKQKLQRSPKITQEELLKTAKTNKPPIPKRVVLGGGVAEDWKPDLNKKQLKALDDMGVEPVVNPDDRGMLGFVIEDTGDIVDSSLIKNMYPDELGFPVGANGKIDPDYKDEYENFLEAVKIAQESFDEALQKTNTKFSQYSRSKGENNYREILLQHKDEDVPGAPQMRQRIDELLKAKPQTEEEAKVVNDELNSLLDRISANRQTFTASHWNQPDVLAHYRVSDMTGPNGEKILYVDELQSDWHQKGRDARKAIIKEQLALERKSLHDQAIEQLRGEVGNVVLNDANVNRLKRIELGLTRDRKAQLEQEIPENAGYRTPEDNQKLYEINKKIERIRDVGMSEDELKEYFTPGKIVTSTYGGHDKVLAFNSGENSPFFKNSYERKLAQAIGAGVDEETASKWARTRALEDSKHDWSVTVIEVDPKTGEPRRGAFPRQHTTSPGSNVIEELRQEANNIERKVPDAPFKKNWHELAVRDILDLAAKEGYDKVAFSPGIEQVKRYTQSLRQAIDEVRYAPGDEGVLTVSGIKDGKTVFREKAIDGIFTEGPAEGKSIAEVFGSNIAKKIEEDLPNAEAYPATPARQMPKMDAQELLLAHGDEMTDAQRNWVQNFIQNWDTHVDESPAGEGLAEQLSSLYDNWLENQTLGHALPPVRGGSIKGDDLTVGGEGMKSFYDQRLPAYVKQYAGKEFKAPSGYTDIPVTKRRNEGGVTTQDIQNEIRQVLDEGSDELMERTMDLSHTLAEERLAQRGIRPNTPEFDDQHWDVMEEVQQIAHDRVAREMAMERLAKPEQSSLRAFTVDVTPEMKQKITTQGQRLYGSVAPPLLPPMAAGAAGAEYVRQSMQQPPAETQERPQEPPEEPQGFQEGGRVGKAKEAAEGLLRVLHGSPTRISLEKGKNLDVTTDQSYAVKRAMDKMGMFGQEGPPMVNKFDIPGSRLLRFEETYSPEDVRLMRRFFNKLPEGRSMTGEEIYEAAGGKDYVLEGLAKAGGFAGYERPSGGSGGVGNWYRVTDQDALTRRAKGGLIGYADGGPKGGKVDLARRGILGLSRLFEEPAQTANLPAVIPTTPVAKNPVAKVPEAAAKPEVVAPLTQLVQKAAETPMSRRDVLKKAGQVAIQQVLPTPKITDVVTEKISPLKQMSETSQLFTPNPEIDNVLRSALSNVFQDAVDSEPFAAVTSAYSFIRDYLDGLVDKKELAKYDKLNSRLRRYYDEDNEGDRAYDVKEKLEQFIKDKINILKPHELQDVHSNFMQDEDLQLLLENGLRYDPDANKVVPNNKRTKDLGQYIQNLTPEELEKYLDASWNAEKRVEKAPRARVEDDMGDNEDYEDYISGLGGDGKARGGLIGYGDGGKVDLAKRGLLGLGRLFKDTTENLPAVTEGQAKSPLASIANAPISRRSVLKQATARTLGKALPEVAGDLVSGQVAKSAAKNMSEPISPMSIIGKLAPLTEKDIKRILERAKNPKYEIYSPKDIDDFMEYFGGNEYIDKQLMRQINKKSHGMSRKQFSEALEDNEDFGDAFADRSADEYLNVVDMIQKHVLPDWEP